ncbi:uncharacterized protein LOC109405893 [Aedes albopictus]|uniref:Secreted protein n=1 Tax=Aedes albopictus TaxID=7160 RepID=A0ABM2A0C5_AEDAL|nr:uncharacterized protein LOC109405893 [Aedes albopictus]KXJ71635.1 hypothetical protein RP20_CCG020119 [Aedes albopictus]
MGLATSSITLLVLCFAAVGRCDLPHYVVYKSFFTALYECGEYLQVDNVTLDQYIYYGYPSIPEVKRLIHCAMVNVGAWNDYRGVRNNVFRYFFQPNALDTEYEQRTQLCLDSICPNEIDQNYRAFETFSCYYRQFGRLIKDDVFNPAEPLEFFQLLQFVRLTLNISPEKVAQFAAGNFLDDPVFKQALFIGALRVGAYSWDRGYLFDASYAQYNVPEIISPCTRKCVEDVTAQYCSADKMEQVYQIYKQCLHTFLDPLLQGMFQSVISGRICEQAVLF